MILYWLVQSQSFEINIASKVLKKVLVLVGEVEYVEVEVAPSFSVPLLPSFVFVFS